MHVSTLSSLCQTKIWLKPHLEKFVPSGSWRGDKLLEFLLVTRWEAVKEDGS